MMKMKMVKALILMGIGLSLAACQGQPVQSTAAADTSSKAETSAGSAETAGAAGDTVYKIGVLQLTQHEALDESNRGFFAALDAAGISYTADQQNAAGELSSAATIADKLVNDQNDLIFTIATPAAQAVSGLTTEIPIVFTAVTDPESAGLAGSENITGSSDLTPVKEQIQLLKQLLPDAKKVGMLYSSAEANSAFQIEMAHAAAEELGLEYEDFSVSSLNEIQSIVESMIGKVDVIYVPTDNMIASGMATVSMIATENNIPIIGAEVAHVKNGALATYGINYYELGYLAGEQAIKILTENIKAGDIPVAYLPAEKCEFTVNEEVAKILNIDVSQIK